ncbi:hypothetical protein FisN_24Lh176 [Fistulifera solaris]|uniref:Uncharacterized protein n=1 Tax=Fistulifera solaris TaxID=1519565 RepID=A0A1Z5K9V5_FISSO|nr:hypothetical protein FisN_24Lh176 [Fistulifera solaris]|eukprot:GAX22891.1 hypothetical protein FisN_24Lh176 [Fistulifera solaris]
MASLPDFSAIKTAMHNYYHPLIRQGSPKPLWHTMMAVSFIMYTTSYIAYKGQVTSHKRDVQKKALHEYYEKHGGAPDH